VQAYAEGHPEQACKGVNEAVGFDERGSEISTTSGSVGFDERGSEISTTSGSVGWWTPRNSM
jgi:hypothetical protein